MTWPLVVLAVPTLLAGAWGIDAYVAKALPSEHPPHDGGFLENLFAPFNHNILASSLGLLAVLAVGGHRVLAGTMTEGQMLEFMQYIGLLVGPLRTLGMTVAFGQRASAALLRVNEVFGA